MKQLYNIPQQVYNLLFSIGMIVAIALITGCSPKYYHDHRHAYKDVCNLSESERAAQREQFKAECKKEKSHRGRQLHIVHYKCK